MGIDEAVYEIGGLCWSQSGRRRDPVSGNFHDSEVFRAGDLVYRMIHLRTRKRPMEEESDRVTIGYRVEIWDGHWEREDDTRFFLTYREADNYAAYHYYQLG